MGLKLTNNAVSRLASGINAAATSISLTPGDGALFPTLAAGDSHPATIIRASDGAIEIVKVTARSTDVLTVTRAQENTTALVFSTGDRIELRLTAQTVLDQAVETATHAATSKATPVDADELPLIDSAASFGLKKLTFANLWTWIKAKFQGANGVVARSSNTILDGTNYGATIAATGTFTQTLTAAATLGNGWWCNYRNDGTGLITLDPNALEGIDGSATIILMPGESCLLVCDGANFKTIGRRLRKVAANVASAATLDLTAVTGDVPHVTGTTAITALTLNQGQLVGLIFDGILTLTHHATTNNLPGAANITTAAGDKALYYYDGTTVWCMSYQRANGTAVVQPSIPAPVSGRRQTVQYGRVDSNGLPDFGGTTGLATMTLTGSYKASAAGGTTDRAGTITSPVFTAPAGSGTGYGYFEIASDGTITTGVSILPFNHQEGGTYSTALGQHTFNISEMTCKEGDGSSAIQKWRVPVFQCPFTSGAWSGSPTWYALNGRYVSAWTNTLPASVAPINFNHNLGMIPEKTDIQVECITAEASISVGQRIKNIMSYVSDRNTIPSMPADRLSATWRVGGGYFVPASGGAYNLLTLANYKYRAFVDRGDW